MSEPSGRPRPNSNPAPPASPFPKSNRLLNRSHFRRVYDQGFRFTSRLFTAFCLDCSAIDNPMPARAAGPRVGFTVPRAIGKSVKRNRIRRRMREAIRLDLPLMGPQWDVVMNPRRNLLDAPFDDIRNEVRKLISRCKP